MFKLQRRVASHIFAIFREGAKEVSGKNANPKCNALMALCCFACVADGDIRDKMRFTFEVFDFDLSGSLTRDEITILLWTLCRAIACLTAQPRSFKVSQLEDEVRSFRDATHFQ